MLMSREPFEGVTSYYDTLLVRRAGLISPKRYLRHAGDHIGKLLQTPGRLHQSLADSSFDTWIKFYRQNEHSPNLHRQSWTYGDWRC